MIPLIIMEQLTILSIVSCQSWYLSQTMYVYKFIFNNPTLPESYCTDFNLHKERKLYLVKNKRKGKVMALTQWRAFFFVMETGAGKRAFV